MSRKGAVAPVILDTTDALIAASVIEQRTEGFDLKQTPFAALREFGRKLSKAAKRRRPDVAKTVMWTVSREEAKAGYRYLMAFSHADVPDDFLTNEGMDDFPQCCACAFALVRHATGCERAQHG